MTTRPPALVRARRWTAGILLAATLATGGIGYQLSATANATAVATTTAATTSTSSDAAASSSATTTSVESTTDAAQTTTSGS